MAEEDAAIRRLYEDLLSAWNDRDARRYASLFTDDASLIGFDGSQVDASELEKHLVPIFTDHPTASYVWRVQEVRPLGPAVALLRARVGMVPPGHTDVNPAVNAVQSLVAVQHNGTWRVALFHNTPAQYHGRSDLAEEHTADMRAAIVEASSRS